jgi:hypothetical protein
VRSYQCAIAQARLIDFVAKNDPNTARSQHSVQHFEHSFLGFESTEEIANALGILKLGLVE